MMDFLSPVSTPQRRGLSGFSRASAGVIPSMGIPVGAHRPRLDTGVFEEGTTNLLAGRTEFQHGGSASTHFLAYGGAVATITNGHADPAGGTGATRIQLTGGTFTLKSYTGLVNPAVAGQKYVTSMWVLNPVGNPTIRIRDQMSGSQDVTGTGQWTRVAFIGTGTGAGQLQTRFETLNAADNLDFYAWHPQAEALDHPTPFTPTSRPTLYGSGALWIEEATTPLLSNQFFTSDSNGDGLADGWTKAFALAGAAWRLVPDSRAVRGMAQEAYITDTGYTDGQLGIIQTGLTGLAGKTLTWHVRGVTSKGNLRLQAYDNTGAVIILGQNIAVTPNVTFDKYITFTVPAGCLNLYVYAMCAKETGWQVNDYIRVFEVGFEEKPYPTSITTVTRAAETYTIPTAGVLSPTQGAIGFWFWADAVTRRQVGNPILFHIPQKIGTPGGGIFVQHTANSTNWSLRTFNDAVAVTEATSADSFTPDGAHMAVVTWSAVAAKLYIDGAPRATIPTPNLPSVFGDYVFIGLRSNGLDHLNTRFSALWMSTALPTDAQVAEFYASGLTFPTAWNTTFQQAFRRPSRGLVIG